MYEGRRRGAHVTHRIDAQPNRPARNGKSRLRDSLVEVGVGRSISSPTDLARRTVVRQNVMARRSPGDAILRHDRSFVADVERRVARRRNHLDSATKHSRRRKFARRSVAQRDRKSGQQRRTRRKTNSMHRLQVQRHVVLHFLHRTNATGRRNREEHRHSSETKLLAERKRNLLSLSLFLRSR